MMGDIVLLDSQPSILDDWCIGTNYDKVVASYVITLPTYIRLLSPYYIYVLGGRMELWGNLFKIPKETPPT